MQVQPKYLHLMDPIIAAKLMQYSSDFLGHFVQRCRLCASPPSSPRSAACWCSEGPTSTTARRCWATPRFCASSVTWATRRSPPCCWSSALAWTWCRRTAWAPCASRPQRDTWGWSCCSANEGPRWGGGPLKPCRADWTRWGKWFQSSFASRDVGAALVAPQ